ncbi:MAG: hypothetical protein ACPGU1_14595 [Myxococcota bacterium]
MTGATPSHSVTVALSYAVALCILSVYGVEVCPFIEGLDYIGVLPVLCGGFTVAFGLRTWLSRAGGLTPLAQPEG